jgi:CheY-like chemotaxis protein
MNGVLSMTQLALDTDLTPEQREYMTTVKASADALLSIINDILDFSKIEAGKLALDTVPFVLRDSLGVWLKTLALRAHKKGLEFGYLKTTSRLDGQEAVAGKRGRVWDYVPLHGVLGGAARPYPCPGPMSPIAVAPLPVLVVDDNTTNRRLLRDLLTHWQMWPITIDGGPAALTALAQAEAEGTPFRLVLLDAQMPEMDGFAVAVCIQQDSSIARAAILMLSSMNPSGIAARCRALGIPFYLTKPFIPSDLWEAITTASGQVTPGNRPMLSATQRVPHSSRHGLCILVAEGSVINQQLAVRILEKRGYQGEMVSTGQEALAALARYLFDLALLDIQMPDLDGFETTTAIRAQERVTGAHLPIIALTARAMSGIHERWLAAGMDDCLTKPLKADDLETSIDRLLG